MRAGSPATTSTRYREPLTAAAFAILSSLAVSLAVMLLRPDLWLGPAFLFGDEAANLFVADRLNAGAKLYQGVAYPYGPLPIHAYAFVAEVWGNSPATYLVLMAFLSAMTCGMTAWLIRAVAGWRTTVLAIVIGLLPTMPLPGAVLGGYTSSIYMPLERLLLLAAVLPWQAPGRRHRAISLAMGMTAGACQAVRFGSGLIALLSVITLDVLSARRHGSSEARGGPISAGIGWLVLGFAVAELAFIAVGLSTMPWDYALEWLSPLQMLETHSARRWPGWEGWRMATTQYVMPVAAAALGVIALVDWARRGDSDRVRETPEGKSLCLLLFYVLGATVYFRNEHHFRQFVWMLVPAGTIGLERFSRVVRAAIALACAAALWPLGSALWQGPHKDTIRLTTPRGYSLHVPPRIAGRVSFLNERLASVGGPVLFLPNGSGWLYAYGVPQVSRHAWFYSRAVVRPFEEEAFASGVGSAATVIACDPARPAGTELLPASAQEVLQTEFFPMAEAHGCRVMAARSR